MSVDNNEDIIDSRDVIDRIEELQGMQEDFIEEYMEENGLDVYEGCLWNDHAEEELVEELHTLETLAAEASDYAPDWEYGEALIRDSYFKEYAQQLADDIGAVDSNAGWPNNRIDWDAAASDLQVDYTSVEFNGVDYWIRSC